MLLDEAVLRQSCGDDQDFARELFGEYETRVQELLVHIRACLDAGRHDDIRRAAHELKGSSLTLGAVEMARVSRMMEDGCKSGEVSELPEWVRDLDHQAHLLFEHLREKSYL